MIDTIESWRWPLGILLVASNIAVWLGVFWENERFSEETKKAGWAMVLRGLALETTVAFLLFAMDTTAQIKSDTQVASLERQAEADRLERVKLEAVVSPRKLTPEEQMAVVARLSTFAGQKVVLTSWATDGEAWSVGQYIGGCLEAAGLIVIDERGKFASIGGYRMGVKVGGTSAALVAELMTAFKDDGNLRLVSEDKDMGKMVLTMPGAPEVSGAAAAIFIGTKPLPDMK